MEERCYGKVLIKVIIMENESLNKIIDLNESIPDRDVDFEKSRNKKLYDKYVNGFVTKIKLLKKEKSFVLDNSFNGVKASHHIMYKCKVNDKGETLLLTPDGHIGYEFLVEFDKKDPQYGIYYGCRGHIKVGGQNKGIKQIKEDWERLEGEITAVLNNTFVDKDFSKRFQPTNNANNKTYWPFWISLGADEDIIEVAARATKLIRNVYKKYINGWKPREKNEEEDKEKEIPVRTKYTEEAYKKICDDIRKKCGEERMKDFDLFIKRLEERGVVILDDRYEKCWKFVELMNVQVHCLIKTACEVLGLRPDNNGSKVPWGFFSPIFLSIYDEDFDSIRKQKPNNDTVDDMKKLLRSLGYEVKDR